MGGQQGTMGHVNEPAPVTLHIYDVTPSPKLAAVNRVLRVLGTGAFHCGVEVYGREWSFRRTRHEGSGVFWGRPRHCMDWRCFESVPMRHTLLSQRQVEELMQKLSKEWPGQGYHILKRNCCHFCDELCRRLGVGPIPEWITHLAGAGAAAVAEGRSAAECFNNLDRRLKQEVRQLDRRITQEALRFDQELTDELLQLDRQVANCCCVNTMFHRGQPNVQRVVEHAMPPGTAHPMTTASFVTRTKWLPMSSGVHAGALQTRTYAFDNTPQRHSF